MEKYEILKKLVSFNTINDKEKANYITEASFIKGTEAIILGLGPITGHEVNEHITIASYEKLVIQYKDLIEKFCLK